MPARLGTARVSVIDVETRLLPDAITMPLLWLGLAFNLFGIYAPLEDSVVGAMAGYLLLWAIYHGFRFATGRRAWDTVTSSSWRSWAPGLDGPRFRPSS